MKAASTIGWTKVAGGWAVNLDRSNAAKALSFPRLEIRLSPQGWICRCLLVDGTSHQVRGLVGSLWAAKRAAVAQARGALGSLHAGVLEELLEGAR